jgi:hypothetical protein
MVITMSNFDTILNQLQEYVKLSPPRNEAEGHTLVKEFFTNGDHGWSYMDFHNGLTRSLLSQPEMLETLYKDFNPKVAN